MVNDCPICGNTASASTPSRGPSPGPLWRARTNTLFPGGGRATAEEQLCSISAPCWLAQRASGPGEPAQLFLAFAFSILGFHSGTFCHSSISSHTVSPCGVIGAQTWGFRAWSQPAHSSHWLYDPEQNHSTSESQFLHLNSITMPLWCKRE